MLMALNPFRLGSCLARLMKLQNNTQFLKLKTQPTFRAVDHNLYIKLFRDFNLATTLQDRNYGKKEACLDKWYGWCNSYKQRWFSRLYFCTETIEAATSLSMLRYDFCYLSRKRKKRPCFYVHWFVNVAAIAAHKL